MKGKISKIMSDRGYGFINKEDSTDEQKDIFFHRSNLEGVDFFDLKEGNEVEFEINQGARGPEAVTIKLVS